MDEDSQRWYGKAKVCPGSSLPVQRENLPSLQPGESAQPTKLQLRSVATLTSFGAIFRRQRHQAHARASFCIVAHSFLLDYYR